MILLIDNYDSFAYNLYQLFGEINPSIKVIRNDAMTIDEIKKTIAIVTLFFLRSTIRIWFLVRTISRFPVILQKLKSRRGGMSYDSYSL